MMSPPVALQRNVVFVPLVIFWSGISAIMGPVEQSIVNQVTADEEGTMWQYSIIISHIMYKQKPACYPRLH